MTTVVLDPGHGGTTVVGGSSPNNATGPNGLLEKTVTLKVALAAELALRGSGVQVLLTRQDDRNVGIVARAAVARRVAAAAFVSIHFNAPGEGGSAQGTETWVGVGHTRISRALAGLVQEHVLAVTGHRDRGVKTGNVSGVIKPANQDPQTANCLVEISFLSGQAEEERRLQNQRYIDELGQALADAVLASLRQRELIGDVELVATLEPDDAASARRLGVIRDADRFALAEAPAVERYAHRELPVSGAVEMTSIEVPFIVPDVSGERPFADLGGDAPIDDPAEMLDGWRRLRTGGPEVEAAVGRFVTVPAALVQLLSDRRRCVARLTASGTDFRGIAQPSPWIGTGFLVDKNLLLTNHHVLNSVEVAQTATVEFDYEIAADDLLAGTIVRPRAPRVFRVDPRRLFVTSPVERGLDFTFVWIDDTAATTFGTIPMERSSFTVKPGEQAFLIHHPQGRPKEISLDDTDVLNIQSTVIHYSSDSDFGSSGAPVFDRQGRLIALHHGRQPMRVNLPDGGSTDVVNEGIKLAAIAIDLENRIKTGTPDASMAATALAAIKGSDTLTGFFGGLGRSVESALGVEAVVDAYRGTDADVDIGFWNIEWLANRWEDPEKLDGAARVIADLNLDIWGLSEVSPPAVRALVRRLAELFGEVYECGFSEPDAPAGKQSTAVIWKGATVRGGPVPWPSDIEPLLRLDSRDPRATEEAVHGRIFDRYPGLFRFELTRDGAPFDFHLVPLHLKAMAEGSLRRRLASRILVRAVRSLVETSGDADVILGGDVNAALASGDLDALRELDFTPMSAEDEAAGAFSYLKSPNSLIDNIFLSPNLTRTSGGSDFFIVAKDRSIDDYVQRISDHRPVLIRLSLAEATTPTSAGATGSELDRLLDEMIAAQSGVSRAPVRRSRDRSRDPQTRVVMPSR